MQACSRLLSKARCGTDRWQRFDQHFRRQEKVDTRDPRLVKNKIRRRYPYHRILVEDIPFVQFNVNGFPQFASREVDIRYGFPERVDDYWKLKRCLEKIVPGFFFFLGLRIYGEPVKSENIFEIRVDESLVDIPNPVLSEKTISQLVLRCTT